MFDVTQIFDGVPPNTGAAITTSRKSQNILDFQAARDIGAGSPLGINVLVTTTFTGGTSLRVALEVGATEGGTYYEIASTPTIPVAQLVANVSGSPIVRLGVPPNSVLNAAAGVLNAPGQYYQLSYVVVGTMATGKVMAWMAPINDKNQLSIYRKGYTVYVAAGQIV